MTTPGKKWRQDAAVSDLTNQVYVFGGGWDPEGWRGYGSTTTPPRWKRHSWAPSSPALTKSAKTFFQSANTTTFSGPSEDSPPCRQPPTPLESWFSDPRNPHGRVARPHSTTAIATSSILELSLSRPSSTPPSGHEPAGTKCSRSGHIHPCSLPYHAKRNRSALAADCPLPPSPVLWNPVPPAPKTRPLPP
jgi:hypothetical protein